MGQYVNISRDSVEEQFDNLAGWFNDMVWKYGFLHEVMENTVDTLMVRFVIENDLPIYQEKLEEYEEDEDKDDFDDFEEYCYAMLDHGSRWWIATFYDCDDSQEAYELLWRYRNTIEAAIRSSTCDEDSVYDNIDEYLGENHE